jgi:hypothetical protein
VVGAGEEAGAVTGAILPIFSIVFFIFLIIIYGERSDLVVWLGYGW